MKFKIGDKVKLNDNIKEFTYARAGVGYDELGKITQICDNGDIKVNFPTFVGWYGIEDELILCNKTFFKKLPNNFTGTIEIENGYIVEKEKLDEVEKEYLSGVIKPFKDKVKYIEKRRVGLFNLKEYLIISLETLETISLPCFDKGIMYKGMEQDKMYTLEELGL